MQHLLLHPGETAEFLDLLPDYNQRCTGEGAMADTAMLFGLLGWRFHTGMGEQHCPYLGSTGTGQVVVDFTIPLSDTIENHI
ncbi:hypothetical protein ACIBHX_44375 [Nonomuraea sp. NPDC050536]|uniref:hypothetical protein n=1 Tax=Nonomuraea sp. NPDC050536 TaxID=3364366 RepID=UPI0037C89239